MSLSWLDPRFNLAATVLALAAVTYLVCVEPRLGRRMYAQLTQSRGHDPDSLQRFYMLTLIAEWAWAMLAVAVIVVAPGIEPAHLGVAWPAGPYAGATSGFAPYFVVIVLVTALVPRRARRGRSVPGQQGFSAMLPRTRGERRMALAVAVNAGICEELLCRGLLIATGVGVGVFNLSPYQAATVAVILFGLAHLYQGWGGVLGTTLIGVIMTGLYFASASLLLPILTHIVIDIRALLLVPAAAPEHDGT